MMKVCRPGLLVLRHPLWHTMGLPLLGLLYVRAKD